MVKLMELVLRRYPTELFMMASGQMVSSTKENALIRMEKSMKESGKMVSLQVKESKPGLMGENMTEYGD